MKVIRLVSFDTNEAEVFGRVYLCLNIGYPVSSTPGCTEQDDAEATALRACSRVDQQIGIERIRLAIRAVDNIAANCLAESSEEWWAQKFRLDPEAVRLQAPFVHDPQRVITAMADIRQGQLDDAYEAQDLLQTANTVLT